MQLVTVRLPSWSATDALALQRCAVLGHHVSECSLSLTLPTGHRSVTYCCYWIVPLRHLRHCMRQSSLTKYALRSLVQAYLHCRHSAGLLQRYTSRWYWLQSVQKTAARLISETIFRDHIHYFTQPHWLLVWRRIVSKSTILPLPIWTLHVTGNFWGRPWLQASTG